MEVKLKNAVVKIKDELTWGDNQKIQSAVMSGAKMGGSDTKNIGFNFDASSLLEAKYVALECAVIEIKEGEKVIEFSRDWINGLSVADGDKLYEAVDKLSKKND